MSPGFFYLGAPESAGTVQKTPQYQRFPFLRGTLVMASDLKSNQKVKATANFTDSKGNPARVDGDVQWITSNSELLALAPDGNACVISAVGPIGTVTVSAIADADLGEGVKPIRLDAEVNVIAGEASAGSLVFGDPEDQ